MDFISLFTSMRGRINRAPYWIGLLSLGLALGILINVVTFTIPPSEANSGWYLAVLALYLVVIVASIPVVIKRLHDRGRSGHYAWLIFGSSIIGRASDVWIGTHINLAATIVSVITLAITLWFVIELGFFRGTAGPNAYGPDPLEAK